jgi:tripartite-type tricarboxylate transporter receptor subunit TctC
MADALPGFNVAPRLMLLAPAGTPPAVIEKLNDAVHKIVSSPELAKAAAAQGAIPAYMDPATLKQEMQRESQDWGKIIHDQKISAQ